MEMINEIIEPFEFRDDSVCVGMLISSGKPPAAVREGSPKAN